MQSLHDTGTDYQIPATYDGAVYDIAVGGDCICGGIGDEFDITYNASSLGVTFLAGSEAIIGGAFFKVTENVTVTLQPNSVIYLCARIDKTQPNGQTASFAQCTEQSMQHQNLNGNGSVRDLLLYVVTTGASGVISVQDRRYIRQGGQGNIITATLNAGQTEITISDARITNDSALSFYTSIYGESPNDVVTTNGSVTMTFDVQEVNMIVGVHIDGTL